MKTPTTYLGIHVTIALIFGSACTATESAPSCFPGQAIVCASAKGCQGSQTCRSDGSGYDACSCNAGATSEQGSATSNLPSEPSPADPTSGGTTSGSSSYPVGTTLGGSASVGGTNSVKCEPKEVTGYVYPPYKKPRRIGGSCTEDDIYDYYSECIYQGSCSDFLPGGNRQSCGSCLEPTSLEANEVGPIVRLGSGAAATSQMNSAGCLDLLGEARCVSGVWTTSICKYAACADACSSLDSGAVVDEMATCMATARSSVCADTQPDVACFANPNIATACSGFNFAAQFVAVARVFCVESH